ncbi:hypothetical protein [Variovorax saccharolyticus]|uniref:hypothetical protein n=1 Tax=Variovorax saccharolyticus TaxID=3053516 RepID=UPI00257914BC|nr:hypothetical protein [Variovorax sp. J31P216]MDM0030181.1 hypothetical protein [Variovorax sp. J31P216]
MTALQEMMYGPRVAPALSAEQRVKAAGAGSRSMNDFIGALLAAPTPSKGVASRPAPPPPSEPELMPENVLMALLWMEDKVATSATEGVALQVKLAGERQVRVSTEKKQKIGEVAAAIEKQAEEKRQAGIWGVVIAAFAAVGAVLLTIATVGCALPVVALAVTGLVAAGIALAEQSMKLAGSMDANDSLIKQMTAKVAERLEDCGVDKTVAKKVANYVVGAVAVGVAGLAPASMMITSEAVVSAVTQIAKDAGANDEDAGWIGFAVGTAVTLAFVCFGVARTMGAQAEAKAREVTLKLSAKATQVLQVTGNAVQAATKVAAGGFQIAGGIFAKETADLQAQNMRLEGRMKQVKLENEAAEQALKSELEAQSDKADTLASIQAKDAETKLACVIGV